MNQRSGLVSNSDLDYEEFGEVVKSFLSYQCYMDQVPGMTFALVSNSELVYQSSIGVKKSGKKIDENSRFRVASISKFFTSMCVMKLRERGKLKLDDRVSDYLDVSGSMQDIRIRHLLSHISGSIRDGEVADWSNGSFADEQEMIEKLSEIETANSPVNSWKYSNLGYGILGLVVEEISGISYEDFVEENIVEPLGMSFTSFESDERTVQGYGRLFPEEGREKLEQIEAEALNSATGLISNTYDLSQLILEAMNENQLLEEVSYREMMKKEWDQERGGYGLGVDISEVDGRKIFGHSGSYFGFTSYFGFDRDNGFGLVLLSNSSGVDMFSKRNQIIKLKQKIEGADEAEFGEDLDKFTGRFSNQWGEVDIRKVGKKIFLYNPRNPVESFHPLERDGEEGFTLKEGSGHGYRDENIEYDFGGERVTVYIGEQDHNEVDGSRFTPESLFWLQG